VRGQENCSQSVVFKQTPSWIQPIGRPGTARMTDRWNVPFAGRMGGRKEREVKEDQRTPISMLGEAS